jgi:hypothetical protein
MFNSTRQRSFIAATLAVLICSAVVSPATAATKWEKTHPRRDQVNDRLERQNRRIHTEVKEGDLTKTQAAALHQDDRQIRSEERLMATQNGGHITKAEQKVLNQQENVVSRAIGK